MTSDSGKVFVTGHVVALMFVVVMIENIFGSAAINSGLVLIAKAASDQKKSDDLEELAKHDDGEKDQDALKDLVPEEIEDEKTSSRRKKNAKNEANLLNKNVEIKKKPNTAVPYDTNHSGSALSVGDGDKHDSIPDMPK